MLPTSIKNIINTTMATQRDERVTDALPNLRKLLSTNSSQEARSWVDDAQFHAQGFKDSLKFFQSEYFDFNSKVPPEKSKEWTRSRPADLAKNIDARAVGLHIMVTADGRPRIETEQQFTERVKAFNVDRPTHDNLAYALTSRFHNILHNISKIGQTPTKLSMYKISANI